MDTVLAAIAERVGLHMGNSSTAVTSDSTSSTSTAAAPITKTAYVCQYYLAQQQEGSRSVVYSPLVW